MTEVKNEYDEFNFAQKITKMTENNSIQNKVAFESKEEFPFSVNILK